MQNTLSIIPPWYKQFWPWFLIFLPSTVVVASIITIVLAMQTQDSLVVDDYYKEAMHINRNLSKLEVARDLGLLADATVMNGKLHLRLNVNQNASSLAPMLIIFFEHSTLANKDFSIVLIQDKKSSEDDVSYVSTSKNEMLAMLNQGVWYVRLEPVDQAWRLKGRISKKNTTIKLSAK